VFEDVGQLIWHHNLLCAVYPLLPYVGHDLLLLYIDRT
jgi:hypothetical protein